MAQLDELIPKSYVDNLKAFNDEANKLNETYMKLLVNNDKIAAGLNSANQSFTVLKKTQSDLGEQTKKLTDAEKEAERISKEQAKTLEALDKQRQAAYKKLADQEQKERDMAEALVMEAKSIEELTKQNKALKAARDKVDTSTESGRQKIAELNKRIDENNEKIKQNVSNLEKQKINIGNYKSAVEGLPGPLGRVGSAMSGLDKVMKIIATTNPFTLILVAVTALISVIAKLWSSTDSGGTKFKALWEGFKAIFDVLIKRVADFVGGLVKIFQGKFKEGADQMAGAFKGMAEQMRNAAKAAHDYEIALDAINDLNDSFISQQAKLRLEIEKAKAAMVDQNLTQAERAKYAKIALEGEKELVAFQKNQAAASYDILVTKIAGLSGETEDFVRAMVEMDAATVQAMRNTDKEVGFFFDNYGDQIKEAEQANAALSDAEREYFSKIKEINGQYSGFLKGMENEYQASLDERLKKQSEIYWQTQKTQEQEFQDYLEYLKKKEEATKTFNDMMSTFGDEEEVDDLDGVQKSLDNINKVKDAAIQAYQSTEEARKISLENELNLLTDLYNKGIISEEEYAARRKEIEDDVQSYKNQKIAEGVAAAAQAGQQILDLTNFMLDAERTRLEQQKAYELELAGDNAERRAAIEERYDKRMAELKTKQAKADKAAAIFKAIINIAQSITAMLSAGPVGIILSALAAAIGAVQLGVIASQPIPKFFTGTESAPDGVISIAEKGRELIKTKSGQLLLANEPTLAAGLKGARIFSNRETEAMLRQGAFGYDSKELQQTLERNNDRLIRTIQNKKEIHINTSKREITEREGGYFRTYKNRYFK